MKKYMDVIISVIGEIIDIIMKKKERRYKK